MRSTVQRRQRLVVLVAVGVTVAGVLAGCGTRLPSTAFVNAQGGEVLTTQSAGPESIGPSTSAVRSGSAGRTVTSGGSAGTRGSSGGGSGTGSDAAGSTAGNTASAVGVTATSLKLGLIVSKTNVLGSGAFSPSLYGAQAYVDAWNARGGQHDRRIQLLVCDDQSSASGNDQCVNSLIGQGVFAFVGNTIFDYDAASVVSKAGVPDVGGQPIDNAYNTYQHLYDIYGEAYPRNGQPGEDGKLYGGTEDYVWFKQNLGVKTAAVVYYNESASERFAGNIENGLKAEGFTVVPEEVDFGVTNFSSAVSQMKRDGVDSIWDALDDSGNAALCAQMDQDDFTVKAKVQNVQSWRQDVAQYSAPCRDSVYVTGKTLAYSDTSNPTIAQFRQDMATYEPDQVPNLAEWTLEGWAAVQWLSDALATCPTSPTRPCVDAFVGKGSDTYTGHGILTPRGFAPTTFNPNGTTMLHSCTSVAKWSDSAGTFVQVSNITTACYEVPQLPYPAD
jgi:branched-chain amino acid transport system substrate-binding protein